MKTYIAMMLCAFALVTTAGVLDNLKDKATEALTLTTIAERLDRIEAALNSKEDTRQALHGKVIGQYITTNAISKRIQRVNLYADGFTTTNAAQKVKLLKDPELVVQDWEKANLPPPVAELRAQQRQAQQLQKKLDKE